MKKKIIWIIVALVVVLGIAGGGIYFYYFKYASADSNWVDGLIYEALQDQRKKYQDGDCLPRYAFPYRAFSGSKNGKYYAWVQVERFKYTDCIIENSRCRGFMPNREETIDYYFMLQKGNYKLISSSRIPKNVPFKSEKGDLNNNIGELPLACCQLNPTKTPTPSPTTSPSPTRTITPSPSSTGSTGPTPSGR